MRSISPARPDPQRLTEKARNQGDGDEDHHAGGGELQRPFRDPGSQPISQHDRDRRDRPEGEGGGGKDDDRLLVAGLERRGRQLRQIAPFGDEDDGERRHEWPAVPNLFLLDGALFFDLLLPQVPANQQGRHDQEENPGPNPNRLPRQQAEQWTRRDGDGALDDKPGGRTEEEGQW